MSTSLKDFQQHIDLIHENKFEIVKKITNSHNQCKSNLMMDLEDFMTVCHSY